VSAWSTTGPTAAAAAQSVQSSRARTGIAAEAAARWWVLIWSPLRRQAADPGEEGGAGRQWPGDIGLLGFGAAQPGLGSEIRGVVAEAIDPESGVLRGRRGVELGQSGGALPHRGRGSRVD